MQSFGEMVSVGIGGGQVWLHPVKEGLRRRREAGAVWKLSLVSEQAWHLAQRLLSAQFGAVGLFFLGEDDSRAKQAVAKAIASGCPCHSVVDDIGIDRAALAHLANLNPSVLGQNVEGALHGGAAAPHEGAQRLLADDDGVMLSDPRCQYVHQLRRLRGFGDQGRPRLMCRAFGLDPLACG